MYRPRDDDEAAALEACEISTRLAQLQAPQWPTRQRAVWLLRGRLYLPEVSVAITGRLLDDEARVRREALRALAAAINQPGVRAAIQLRISDPNLEVRQLARRILDGQYDPI